MRMVFNISKNSFAANPIPRDIRIIFNKLAAKLLMSIGPILFLRLKYTMTRPVPEMLDARANPAIPKDLANRTFSRMLDTMLMAEFFTGFSVSFRE